MAFETMRAAVELGAALRSVSEQAQLPLNGYGALGTCVDTAAILRLFARTEQGAPADTNIYALLPDKRAIIGALENRKAAPGADSALIDRLILAVQRLPRDVEPNASQLERISSHLALWPKGRSPFVAVQRVPPALRGERQRGG